MPVPAASSPTPNLTPASAAPSLGRRMACWLYEGMLMFGVVFIAGYLFGTLSQTRNALDNRNALQAFLFIVFGIYFTWFWAKGQTLAMKTWHIRVVDTNGQPGSQSRALARYVLSWLWFLPPLLGVAPFALPAGEVAVIVFGWVAVWALASRLHLQQQFWHDALAGTRLVHWRLPAGEPLPAGLSMEGRYTFFKAIHACAPSSRHGTRKSPEVPHRPASPVACHGLLAAGPAYSLGRNGVPPGGHRRDGAAAGVVLAGPHLGGNGPAGQHRGAAHGRGIAQHRHRGGHRPHRA